MLEDIAVTVGAKVISDELGTKLETAELDVLGRARRVIATKDSTIIVGGKGQKKAIESRIESLKVVRENTTSKYDKEKLDERIGKLSGGVAVIRVGAATETEMRYLKLKIEDAVNATKAAIAEGIVAGGGSALVKVSQELLAKYKKADVDPADTTKAEYWAGYVAVAQALTEPLRQIAINAGKEPGVIQEHVTRGGKNSGYDALDDTFVNDMFEKGIIDPVKVARLALEHASSAVAMLLTTEVAITDEPEPKPPHRHNHEEEGF